MKKLFALSLLFAGALSLCAQDAKQNADSKPGTDEPKAAKAADFVHFSSLGETWIELNGGVAIGHYKVDNAFSNYKGGAMAGIWSNMMLDKRDYFDKQITVGIDVGAGFEYRQSSIGNLDMDAYNFGGYIKPYVTFFKSEFANVSVFIAPYFTYTRMEHSAEIANDDLNSDNIYKLGFSAGFEFSILEDFYIAPVYRYVRTQSWDLIGNGYDKNVVEVELGYRIYENVSLHINYAHEFEKGVAEIKTSADIITGGVRYTF